MKLQYGDRTICKCFKVINPLWVFAVNGWGEVEEEKALKPLQRGCGWGCAKGLY